MDIKVKAPRVNTFVDLGLLLFVLKTGFDVSGILPHNTIVDNITIVVGLGAFVISVLQQNYSANTLFKYAIVTVLSLCSTLTSGQSVIIITVITILAIRQLDFTKVIRKIRIWSTWFICIHSIYFLIQLLLGNAYKNSILQAYQRTDVVSKVALATSTIQYVFQLLVLWLFKNYYYYVVVTIVTQAVTNVVTAAIANKLYPEFRPNGKLPRDVVQQINHRIQDLFTAKIGSVVIGSADTIVISAFLGLTVLAVYQNYYFIMNSICGFITVIFSSITAGIGNSLVTESAEKNFNDFKKFTFIICFILCICCCCFAGLYQPFMRIWVGNEFMLDYSFVILFCILFYCLELAMVWATVKDAAGMWHTDRFRPLIGAGVNLIMNIILVQKIGLYGIILSTVISYVLISMPWLIHNLFKYLYKGSIVAYLKDLITYILVAILSTSITIAACNIVTIEGLMELLIKGVLCIAIPIVIEILAYRKRAEFFETMILVRKMLGRT